ncbi:MAG: hypothetical protein JW932_04065 [Deltaproteobacteria bacterium]|nr:hypothetical protein [Deltaproteobacteria bacterium]
MESFSNLNKSGSISPSSSGIWRIQKKRRTTDRNHRKRDPNNPEEKETPDVIFDVMGEEMIPTEEDQTENQPEQERDDKEKGPGNKIDLTI